MAAYKTGTFVRSKYYSPLQKTPLKWIPRSKSGASKSRPGWVAHTRIGNVGDYPPPPGGVLAGFLVFTVFEDDLEARKSLKAFFLQPKS